MAEIIGRINLEEGAYTPPPSPRKKEITPRNWEEVIEGVCITEKRDSVFESRRRELMEQFNPEEFIDFLRKQKDDDYEYLETLKDYRFLKGYVFEYLVNKELNDKAENSFVGEYIIQCLQNPKLIGIEKFALRNPDHLGVEVDAEKGEAHITGMYEVKMGQLTDRARSQIRNFYKNIEMVIAKINENIPALRERDPLLPPSGITLQNFEKIYKNIVSPLPETEFEEKRSKEKEKELEDHGWGLKKSVFTYRAMEILTKHVSKEFIGKETEKLNKKGTVVLETAKAAEERKMHEAIAEIHKKIRSGEISPEQAKAMELNSSDDEGKKLLKRVVAEFSTKQDPNDFPNRANRRRDAKKK